MVADTRVCGIRCSRGRCPPAGSPVAYTRAWHTAVLQGLGLSLAAVGTPPPVALSARSVTGLSLLLERPPPPRVTRHRPGRGHDARNRLVRRLPLATRAVLAVLLRWVQRRARRAHGAWPTSAPAWSCNSCGRTDRGR